MMFDFLTKALALTAGLTAMFIVARCLEYVLPREK